MKLGFAALLPALFAVGCYLLEKRTKFLKMSFMARQCVYGVLFGALAIIGTEWGIPIDGAQVNCRDAAVLTAGLLFGAPAGIIAGVIGGLERWFAVYWGVGAFTRVACSVSTVIAGVYAALLRKYMFENKKPGWALSFAIGIVMEVFHMTMVFLTNMGEPERAMAVVRACTVPMVLANGFSVLIATLIIVFLSSDCKMRYDLFHNVRISQTIQRWLLIAVVIAFASSRAFVYRLQTTLPHPPTDSARPLAPAA
ncbi:MAG: ECF transporter S component, partial [Clostridia bacterium]|nr:ECF transporter S component [Clostridia bacterium]